MQTPRMDRRNSDVLISDKNQRRNLHARSLRIGLVNTECCSTLVMVATTVTSYCSSASSCATHRKNEQKTSNTSPTKKTMKGSMTCLPSLGTCSLQCRLRWQRRVSKTHVPKVLGDSSPGCGREEVGKAMSHHVAGKAVTKLALEALSTNPLLP